MISPHPAMADLALDPATLDSAARLHELINALRSDGSAAAALAALGYDRATTTETVTRNRTSLLRVSSMLRRVFVLHAPDAPGGCFVGAEVDPAAFDLPVPDGPGVGVSGFGLSLADAFQGCVGEAAEYLSLIRRGDETAIRGSLSDLAGRGAAVPSPDWLYAGLGLDSVRDGGRSIDWLSVARASDGVEALVPADLCLRRLSGIDSPVLRPAESSGHAAGPDLEHAARHALLELIERDAYALWWFGGRPARLHRPTAGVTALLARLRGDRPTRQTWLLDIDSDLAVPVVAALSSDLVGRGLIIGASARPRRSDAAWSALIELCQMEMAHRLVLLKVAQRGDAALNARDRLVLARSTMLSVGEHLTLAPSGSGKGADLPEEPAEPPLEGLPHRLERAGFPVYMHALRVPVPDGIAAVHAIAPGLQSARNDWLSDRLVREARRNGRTPSDVAERISLM